MPNTKPIGGSPDHDKTRKLAQNHRNEMQHAARPGRGGLSEKLSWLVAIGTGATVAWRSFQAGRDLKKADQAKTDPDALHSPRHAANKAAVAQKGTKEDEANARTRAQVANARNATRRYQEASQTALEQQGSASRRNGAAEDTSIDIGASTAAEKVEGGALSVLKELWTRFSEDEVTTRANALSFIALFTLVPLILSAIGIAGFFIHSPQQAEDVVRQMVSSLLPGQKGGAAINEFIAKSNISASAQTLIERKWFAVIVGLGSLLYGATGLFIAAADPMNKAWDVQETRNFLKLRAVALGIFLGTLAFFALSLFVTSGAHGALKSIGIPDNLPRGAAFFVDAAFTLLAIGVNTVLFGLIYKVLPNTSVSWKSAFFGGAIVGTLWELFKQGFAMYLAHFGDFDKTYGAFSGIFLLVSWIYYSSIILLAGAEICKVYHEHKEEGGVAKRPAKAA